MGILEQLNSVISFLVQCKNLPIGSKLLERIFDEMKKAISLLEQLSSALKADNIGETDLATTLTLGIEKAIGHCTTAKNIYLNSINAVPSRQELNALLAQVCISIDEVIKWTTEAYSKVSAD